MSKKKLKIKNNLIDDIDKHANATEDQTTEKTLASKQESAEGDITSTDIKAATQTNTVDTVTNQTDDAVSDQADNSAEADTQQEDCSAKALSEQTDKPTDQSDHESTTETTEQSDDKEPSEGKGRKQQLFGVIRIVSIIAFVTFSILFINEVVIQPYRIKKSVALTRDLYNKPTEAPIATTAPVDTNTAVISPEPVPSILPTPTPDPNRDAQGRLLQFQDLLAVNEDVKGWLNIPDTNVDYVVVQAPGGDQDYYLDKDIEGNYSKAGTLFLDSHGTVENKSQNLVIHGHNMVSTTEKMFHYILKYKNVSYYKQHPLINFDTIYETGQWKVFAVIVTNGSSKHEKLFDFTQGEFSSSSEFLNFVYQTRIRSVLNIDGVDITDDDRLLMLSTCSYEVDNYRTVVIARRVRDGEDPSVDLGKVSKNKNPLYPESYYKENGGEAPVLPETFEEALADGKINWYTPPTTGDAE